MVKSHASDRYSRLWSTAAAAIAGLLAALSVLGIGHVVAALIDPAASPFYAIGAAVVDHTPHALKDAAIRQFGTNDKLALFVSMAAVMIVFAMLLGIFARRRPRAGSGLLVLLGGVVVWAALQRPTATPWFALPTLVGVVAGIVVLLLLVTNVPGNAQPGSAAPGTAELNNAELSVAAPAAARAPRGESVLHSGSTTDTGGEVVPSRRRFLALAAGVGAVVVGAAVAGQWVGARLRDVVADRARFLVPRPTAAAPVAGSGVRVGVPGVTEFVTPNERFYRVDTALQLPALPSAEWRLRIHGMVERPMELDFAALRQRTAVERVITMTCVSNEVGGELAGTAVWTGYPLEELLAEAGVRPEADMLLSRSIDGFTASTPVSAVTDGRDALLAVGMNGEPLPIAHGYPARLIVPGLYGYVSATKWVIDLELTRFDRAEAYWTERGWAAQAPVKTASRIDVPASFATVPAGVVTVAGVAWAQQRGIDGVEVQVDNEPWQQATLADEYSTDTWRQWRWLWTAAPGLHTLRVRATDRDGNTQTDRRTPPFPDGATGWHSRVVTVR
ncbi:molybdopterin-dependent oxidoreductase [Nocardia altamirensis]|uniref:molybdopterin-dependent oxidoreductase n=1 Tax=Nocardia altamirensis TaxID=472158 RepID=UPI00083FDEC3|nr:molybdopterin-dependent oxidoreductase [Nocardia altamirensis]